MWISSNNISFPTKSYYQPSKSGSPFPEQLTRQQLDQMNKVFNTCIHPTQYLPIQFTDTNASTILQIGLHVSEQILLNSNTPTSSLYSIQQLLY